MNAIPYGRQQIEAQDIEAVINVLKSDFLTQGPAITEFEKSVTDFLKKISSDPQEIYANAVNNGTTALHLACLALGLKPGNKVLVTANSFAASANCALYCGAEVEFVDTSPSDQCIDLDALEITLKKSAPGTYAGVIAVDYAGHVVDLKRLREIANQYGLWIIEDACHAIGATRTEANGSVYAAGAGKYADIGIFSFHPVKHIATGEGGMILTRSPEINEKIKSLRTHGITKDPTKMSKIDGGWYYEMQALGYNGRISDILCALGTSQMKRIESNLKRRREIAARYHQELKDLPITLPLQNKTVEHAYHLFVIHTHHRKALYEYLVSKKIHAQVHYIPIHKLPYYIQRYGEISKPNSEHHYETCLSIPMFHSLTDEDQTRVITEIHTFFKNIA